MNIVVAGGSRPYVEGDSFDFGSPLAWTIDDVLSQAECAAQIARIDELGPVVAPISMAGGPVIAEHIRNNQRVIFDDSVLAQSLFERLQTSIPPRLAAMTAVGNNERFRGYRYLPGHRFAPHRDGCFVRNANEESLLTVIVYLNADFDGGATEFCDYGVAVTPQVGRVLLFQHLLMHEGCVVTRGTKYALRTDVMFRR